MTLNVKVALLLLGLLVGGVVGYVTRPVLAEIRVGNTAIELQNDQVSTGPASGLTTDTSQRILLFALAGGVIGLLVGFAAGFRH